MITYHYDQQAREATVRIGEHEAERAYSIPIGPVTGQVVLNMLVSAYNDGRRAGAKEARIAAREAELKIVSETL